ncbi:hypothetical protein OSTOST_08674 [Ostertagia ostertagi]
MIPIPLADAVYHIACCQLTLKHQLIRSIKKARTNFSRETRRPLSGSSQSDGGYGSDPGSRMLTKLISSEGQRDAHGAPASTPVIITQECQIGAKKESLRRQLQAAILEDQLTFYEAEQQFGRYLVGGTEF